jgi:hypothetical protein
MNIEEITSSLKDIGAGLYSNMSLEYPVSNKNKKNNKSKNNNKSFFNSTMAEVSQYIVFEEILKENNSISFTNIEDKVYDRYDNILKNCNSNFIFSLKMPFMDWIKLQIELGNIFVNIIKGDPMISVSKPIEEVLKTKTDLLYTTTGEHKPSSDEAAS